MERQITITFSESDWKTINIMLAPDTDAPHVARIYSYILQKISTPEQVEENLNSLNWLDTNTILEVKRLWATPVDYSVNNSNRKSPKLMAALLIREVAAQHGFTITLQKITEIKDEILLMKV